jgi:hypothetical protein
MTERGKVQKGIERLQSGSKIYFSHLVTLQSHDPSIEWHPAAYEPFQTQANDARRASLIDRHVVGVKPNGNWALPMIT